MVKKQKQNKKPELYTYNLYGCITAKESSDFTEFCIELMGIRMANPQKKYTVVININSKGGYLESSQTIAYSIGLLLESKISVTGYVSGDCMSGAVIILMACPIRAGVPKSKVMIHKLSVDALDIQDRDIKDITNDFKYYNTIFRLYGYKVRPLKLHKREFALGYDVELNFLSAYRINIFNTQIKLNKILKRALNI